MQKVTIVNITKNGSDKAVFLNSSSVLTADPSCNDDVSTVDLVASNLAAMFNTTVVEVDHEACENWNWGDVRTEIFPHAAAGKDTTVLLDSVISDWRFSAGCDESEIPESARGEYAIKIEANNSSNQVWFGIYNKAFDQLPELQPMGIYGLLEVRDGVPAMSVGITEDENIIHIMSNNSSELSVINDCDFIKPTWTEVTASEAKFTGLCFPFDSSDSLLEARTSIANDAFDNYDFNGLTVKSDCDWVISDNLWSKSVSFDGLDENPEKDTLLVIEFVVNGTHITRIDHGELHQLRRSLAEILFASYDFGTRIVSGDGNWEIDAFTWSKTVFFEDDASKKFEIVFVDNSRS